METSIRIKNIGPLTDTGIITLSRFNIIVGKQSTGKSTFMKILSYCEWLEKKLMTDSNGDVLYNYTHYYKFQKELNQFHRLNDSYFSENSLIEYNSDSVKIIFQGNKENAQIIRKPNFEALRHNTKLSFIPSERNLVTAIRNVDRAYRATENDLIFNHIFEWSKAKESTSAENPIDLSVVGDMEYYYDASKETDQIVLKKDKREIAPFYASSGVQSVLPIMVMVNYLTSKNLFDSLDMTQFDVSSLIKKLTEGASNDVASTQKLLEQFTAKQKYKNTKLFLEEPEQNLFPESQQALVNFMVERINAASYYTHEESTLTLTTHSPYIITAFNVLMRAADAMEADAEKTSCLISPQCIIPHKMVKAYYVNEDGEMKDIIDSEINMISGLELDNASTIVEDRLSALNDIIYE